MNKRQLKQSAMDDFMRSLDQLDELLGHDSEGDDGAGESLETPPTDGDQSPPSTSPSKPSPTVSTKVNSDD